MSKPSLFLPLGKPPIPQWFLDDRGRWKIVVVLGCCNLAVSTANDWFSHSTTIFATCMVITLLLLAFLLTVGGACAVWAAKLYWFAEDWDEPTEIHQKDLYLFDFDWDEDEL